MKWLRCNGSTDTLYYVWLQVFPVKLLFHECMFESTWSYSIFIRFLLWIYIRSVSKLKMLFKYNFRATLWRVSLLTEHVRLRVTLWCDTQSEEFRPFEKLHHNYNRVQKCFGRIGIPLRKLIPISDSYMWNV